MLIPDLPIRILCKEKNAISISNWMSGPDYSNQRRWQNHSGHQPRFDFPMKTDPPLTGDMKLKSEIRERRHAALSVLTDQELLMIHAVRNNEVRILLMLHWNLYIASIPL
jgi:hypothetical protein